jgi:hypothetical protein
MAHHSVGDNSKSQSKLAVIQRSYRFNGELFEKFEEDCVSHLANPKRVLEALIVHWLDLDTKERTAIAQKYGKRYRSSKSED